MKKIKILFVLLLTAVAVFAQQQKGDFQVQTQFSYTNMSATVGGSSFSISMGQLYGSVSKFVTDKVEVGVSPILSITSAGNFSRTSLKLSLFSNYSFLTENAKLVPYAGASLIMDTGGIDINTGAEKTTASFGLRGGLRYFVTERINIDVGPSYYFGSFNTFIMNAGLGYLFGKH